jgi:adenylate kinase family enzyme
VELDALFHGPNWSEVPDAEFFARIEAATTGDDWIVDGNFSRARHLTWPRADKIVWIDLPLSLSYTRLVARTFRRWVTREQVCGDNRESLWEQLAPGRSLWLFTLRTHGRRKAEYDASCGFEHAAMYAC